MTDPDSAGTGRGLGIAAGEVAGNPHSAFRTPHSALRTPHSALHTPHSAFRNPQFFPAVAVLFLPFPTLLAAQTAEDCLGCHSDESLKATRQGKTVSAFVDQKRYAASIHGRLPCVACHANLEKAEFPHKEDTARVNCGACHPGATRRFAGYLTHATHHDPRKYSWLFWTFWSMTALLVGTFTVSGAHTMLRLPRALQMRRAVARPSDRRR
jgi:hypothetical protein